MLLKDYRKNKKIGDKIRIYCDRVVLDDDCFLDILSDEWRVDMLDKYARVDNEEVQNDS